MTTTIVMSAYEISGLSHPSYPSAAARKKYIDEISSNSIQKFRNSSNIWMFVSSQSISSNRIKTAYIASETTDVLNKAYWDANYSPGGGGSGGYPSGLQHSIQYASGALKRHGGNWQFSYSPLDNTLSMSGNTHISGQFFVQGSIISGLSAPTFPSAAANKKYVDDREVNIEGQITTLQSNLEGQISTLGIEDLDDVAIMTPANGRVLTWIDAQSAWSSQAAQGGVTYISSCTDASISGWTSGQVLTWNGSDWSNKYPALTFNVANVRLSANTYLNLTQFNTGTGKSCYVLQASCCNSSCASISGIRVQVLDDNSVIYETSSSTIRQGGPLAKSNAASQMKIRFMYSGSHSRFTGYKYGNAFVQTTVY